MLTHYCEKLLCSPSFTQTTGYIYIYLSVYLICVYRHTYIHTCGVDAGRPLWYSVYLLYWYKSTNTDAEGAAKALLGVVSLSALIAILFANNDNDHLAKYRYIYISI